jgi:hypothetical protein
MLRNYLYTTFASMLIAVLFVFPVQASETAKVVIIFVNQLSLEDLQDMEQLEHNQWLEAVYLGAMNLRTAGTMNDVNNMVTLGSGTRAVGDPDAAQVMRGDESLDGFQAYQVYAQLTGRDADKEKGYVLNYQQIIENNEQKPYTIIPGLLGKTLREHGLKTAVIGNSDQGKARHRLAPLMLMDEQGIVDYAEFSQASLRKDIHKIYGLTTDYEQILKQVDFFTPQAAVTAVELGDLHRLYTQKNRMPDPFFQQQKQQVLQQINRFMSTVIERQQPGELIIFLSPMVNEDAKIEKSLMAPLLLIPKDGQDGVLRTPTTRQPGIVANVDVAPTILNWLGLPIPREMTGRTIQLDTESYAFWKEWEKIKHVYATRSEVLYSYVTFQIIVLIVAAWLWFYGRQSNRAFSYGSQLVQILLLVLVLSPFSFLLLSAFTVLLGPKLTIFVLFLVGIGLALLLSRLPFVWTFLIVGIISWLPILIDGMLANAMLMKRSYLGYDPIIGARFYGIGNEYMGVVIGSSILSWGMLLELVKGKMQVIKAIAIAGIGVFLLFFGLPRWGTNAGGTITAAAAYTTSFLRLFEVQWNRRLFIWILFSVFIAVSALFIINVGGEPSSHTHIGRAMQQLLAGDLETISHIIQRKVEMNWKLIQVSSWSKVFITSLLILGALFYRPQGALRRIAEQYPFVFRCYFGIIIGAFTALIINDSGIVAAATTIIYVVVPLLYLGLYEKREVTET